MNEHWEKAVEAALDVCYENVHESGEARLRVEVAGMLRAALPHLVEAVLEEMPWQEYEPDCGCSHPGPDEDDFRKASDRLSERK